MIRIPNEMMIWRDKQTGNLWNLFVENRTDQSPRTSQPCWTHTDFPAQPRRGDSREAIAVARVTNNSTNQGGLANPSPQEQGKGAGRKKHLNHSFGLFSWIKIPLYSHEQTGQALPGGFELLTVWGLFRQDCTWQLLLAFTAWISFFAQAPPSSAHSEAAEGRTSTIGYIKAIQSKSCCLFLWVHGRTWPWLWAWVLCVYK